MFRTIKDATPLFTLSVCGDFYPGDAKELPREAIPATLAGLQPAFSADYRILQLETPLSLQGEPILKDGPAMQAAPHWVEFLKQLGIDLALLANNHIGDFGEAPIAETLHVLDAAGIAHAGAGMTPEAAALPVIAEINGVRLGVLNFAEHEFGLVTAEHGGSNPLDCFDSFHALRELKTKCDIALVTLHGGNEHNPFPAPRMVRLCREFVDAGAAAVVNIHPHCPQGIEVYRGAPIVYSPGNFFFPVVRNYPAWNYGYIPLFDCDRSGVCSLRLLPYHFDCRPPFAVTPLDPKASDRFLEYLETISLPIADPALLADKFDLWSAKSADYFFSVLEEGAKARHNPERYKYFMNLRNFFTCQSHHALMINLFKLREEDKLEALKLRIENDLNAYIFTPGSNMKIGILLLSLCLITLQAGDFTIRLQTDKPDSVYRQGEKITYHVEALENGKPAIGKPMTYEWHVDDKPLEKGKITSTAAPLTFEVILNRPGGTWLRVWPLDAGGKPDQEKLQQLGAMVDPLEIRQAAPEPADFDAFWKTQREKLDAVPVKTAEVKVSADREGKFECYDVKVDCAGGMPVSGYLVKPAGAKPRSLKAVVSFHGAGVRGSFKNFRPNAISFDVNAHGIENGKDKAFYDALSKGELANYRHRGLNDREEVYFKGMFLRAMRALDYIMTRPEWDGKNLIVTGVSQGGGQSLVAAALEPKVTLCLAGIPSMADHAGVLLGRIPGGPRWLDKVEKPVDPKLIEITGYYDLANFAKRIRCEIYLSTGFADSTCSPTSVYAAFNNIPPGVKKVMTASPAMGHKAPNRAGIARLKEVLE